MSLRDTYQKETRALLIKQKIDEASKEAWELIAKKALEVGLASDSDELWLFYTRVNNIHFYSLHAPRIKMLFEQTEVE